MKIQVIYNLLNEVSPFFLQEEWDNSGLLVGNFNNNVERIYITLDLDEELLKNIKSNSLILAHHPLIFKPLKNIIPTNSSSKLLIKLIKKDISFIAMHTNFDKTHLNKYVAEKILSFKGRNENFIYYADVDMSFEDILNLVEKKLNLKQIKFIKTKDKIKKIALTTGAGMSLMPNNVDLFLTGDIKYHEAMNAKIKGISLIDIGHFESEIFFVECMYEIIKHFNIEIIKLKQKNPFTFKLKI